MVAFGPLTFKNLKPNGAGSIVIPAIFERYAIVFPACKR
jgi:hypothetical protein